MPKKPTLTENQIKFANLLVYEAGSKSPAECAFESGYKTRPRQAASELKNPKIYPLVAAYIKELRQEAQEKYGVNYQSHLQEMARLRDEARKLKQMSPAVTAEKNRGQVGGLYIVDRQVNINANVDLSKLSPEELQDKLDQMYEEDIKDVTPRKSKPEASEVKQDPESD
ncbi:MAG: hypothetical protein CM15mV77_350 [uncultured marine virus]|nr:MAG: hypothetical protein CM15mV77_350 [uncultured marine virus]